MISTTNFRDSNLEISLKNSTNSKDNYQHFFLERYKDQEAQDAHGKTDYFRELGAQMGSFMAGAPEIKVLQSV